MEIINIYGISKRWHAFSFATWFYLFWAGESQRIIRDRTYWHCPYDIFTFGNYNAIREWNGKRANKMKREREERESENDAQIHKSGEKKNVSSFKLFGSNIVYNITNLMVEQTVRIGLNVVCQELSSVYKTVKKKKEAKVPSAKRNGINIT